MGFYVHMLRDKFCMLDPKVWATEDVIWQVGKATITVMVGSGSNMLDRTFKLNTFYMLTYIYNRGRLF